ncbi:hypothetical protein DA01_07770 [Dehalococcoides mccartyi]|uniref:Uncharacterized protein n=1 Tax=Dehalococcoides mccartyi TaxID=61435 RepID=A0A0V8M0L6_9CHLR|nr:hypothetical protein B1773_04405 [Dehalococcoides mccartyi]KSV17314.1 hypothetical protein DA01_07770 [Dehalococcoides mccartyi]
MKAENGQIRRSLQKSSFVKRTDKYKESMPEPTFIEEISDGQLVIITTSILATIILIKMILTIIFIGSVN